MNFDGSAEQQALHDEAARFGRETLCDDVEARDRRGEFSRPLWDACAAQGLTGLIIPEAWRGQGHDCLTAARVLEGLGRGALDNGMVFSVAAHAVACAGPIVHYGSDAQKDEWLPRLADGACIGAPAVVEADAGSNVLGLTSRAVKDGAHWVLDGSKIFVTNAPIADLLLIYARTGEGGLAGLSCFLVPKDTPGLEVAPPAEKMGLRTSPMAEVFLDGCRVPDSAVLGGIGSGAMIFNQTVNSERVLVMAPALGVMERLLDRCTRHARERRIGDQPIGAHQAVSHRIADMETDLEQSRLLLYRAAWHTMRHGIAVRESAMAKLVVSEAYVRACRSALQLFGGYGYLVEYGLERELRDALATTLYVGTSEIQKNLIAGLRGLK